MRERLLQIKFCLFFPVDLYHKQAVWASQMTLREQIHDACRYKPSALRAGNSRLSLRSVLAPSPAGKLKLFFGERANARIFFFVAVVHNYLLFPEGHYFGVPVPSVYHMLRRLSRIR